MVNLNSEKKEILKRTDPDNDANMKKKTRKDKSLKLSKDQKEPLAKSGAEEHPLPGQSSKENDKSSKNLKDQSITVIKEDLLNSGAEVHPSTSPLETKIEQPMEKTLQGLTIGEAEKHPKPSLLSVKKRKVKKDAQVQEQNSLRNKLLEFKEKKKNRKIKKQAGNY